MDLDFLRHDKAVRPAHVKQHLKHIPSYLMPRVTLPGQISQQSPRTRPEDVPFHSEKKRRKGFKKPNAKVKLDIGFQQDHN